MKITLAADSPILKTFESLPDPRKTSNQIYPLKIEPLAKFLI